jgi:glycogen debranching enzyme
MHLAMLSRWIPVACGLATLLCPAATAAQDARAGTIPFFELGTSPLALSGDARPNVYLASAGRRAIAMGTEDGRFEMWSWPYKWMHDFQLAFRVPKYSAPIPARDVARRVSVRPEGATIEYAYETFTVRQHVFAALDEPAVIMLLEVDAIRPMEIIASFIPDIHLAWPASLGGQYLVWNADARAFLFSESRRRVNAFLGSPAVTQASDVPAHMLAAAPPQFVIGVGGAGERYTEPRLGEPPGKNVNIRTGYIPIVLAGGEMSRDSARALYQRLTAAGAAEREWRRRVAHADSIRATTLSMHSPEPELDRALEWAKLNLDEALVCNPDLGCGLVAGYGLSGAASDRPGFGWFFGGDGAINSFAMSGAGQFALAREGAFRFFAKYQRADGKITHEISQGAGKIDWFGAYPYAFYHGDTTPFWILAIGEYWRQSADSALVRELWPNIERAFEWSRKADSDGDGLMENPIAGAGALEVGDLQIGIVSDVYLSGVWVAALERFARMAVVMGKPELATSAKDIRRRALRTLEEKLWLPSLGQYAFALLEGGKVNENLTAWPATAMSFGVFDADRGAAMAAQLASARIMTDWGARPLSSTSALFDPLHYNNGAVWPFVTGWVSLAQYMYHNAHAGRFALDAIVRTGFDEARGRNPEVLSGRFYKPLDTAVPHQFFATSMVMTPLIRGLLGIDVDAPARRMVIAPHLPPTWDSVRVENIPVGRERVSVRIRRTPGLIEAIVTRSGGDGRPLEISFSPAIPHASNLLERGWSEGTRGARERPQPGDAPPFESPGDKHAPVVGSVVREATFQVRLSEGWTVVPPRSTVNVGDRSTALRIVSERWEPPAYVLTIEARAGSMHRLRLRPPSAIPRPRVAASAGTATLAEAPDADGYRSLAVSVPGEGGDSDGFVRVTLRLSPR